MLLRKQFLSTFFILFLLTGCSSALFANIRAPAPTADKGVVGEQALPAVTTGMEAGPIDDPSQLKLAPVPFVLPIESAIGEIPVATEWIVAVDWPDSPTAVPVLSRPAQTRPLTAEQAQAMAKKFGFNRGLTVELHSGLSADESAALGLFVAFEGFRSLALSTTPYYYNDLAHWHKGPDLAYEQSVPIAEQFLQVSGWLNSPYEIGASDQGEGVLFLPLYNGLRFPVPAYAVRVAADGGVSGMNIYPLDDLSSIGDYPIMTAETAWSEALRLGQRTSYRVSPPLVEILTADLPIEYSSIPPAGESGDFFTTIWAYQPLSGDGAPIIRSSDFFRVTGDAAILRELALQTDRLVHLWGTVREGAPGLAELALERWETVPDAGGVPMFFGKINHDGNDTYLVDEANQRSFLLANAPAGLEAGAEVSVSGMPAAEDQLQ
ncbi:MAG: hypothetical protein R3293_20605, partial [Candidatus Promineifilaceae bacterium]|nr:hypothetical protein [Candidatus Promineifilaceae bacterium]